MGDYLVVEALVRSLEEVHSQRTTNTDQEEEEEEVSVSLDQQVSCYDPSPGCSAPDCSDQNNELNYLLDLDQY